jgi:hypothetical protein
MNTLAIGIALRLLEQNAPPSHELTQALDGIRNAVGSDLDALTLDDVDDFKAGLVQLNACACTPALKAILTTELPVEVATIEHRHGVNIYVTLTSDAMVAELAEFADEWKGELQSGARDDYDSASSDEERIDAYFDSQHDESYSRVSDTLPALATLLDREQIDLSVATRLVGP